MKRNRLGFLTVALACVLVLSACSSAAVKEIVQKIDSIETIGESTGQQLKEIEQAYNELSDEEKEKVENYDRYLTLTEEYESYMRVLHVKNLIASVDTVSLETKDVVDEIHLAYDALTEEEKSQVDNYDQFSELERKFLNDMQKAATAIAENIDSYSYEDRDTLAEEISIYYDYMTDEQKLECLGLHLYYQEAPGKIEESVRETLKEPYSLVMKNMEIDNNYVSLGDYFAGSVDIIYQIVSPKGETDDIEDTVFVNFNINIETKEITFESIYGFYTVLHTLL